jgi:hypothetical protein
MAYYDKAKVYRAKQAREYLATLEGPEANILKQWISDKDDYIEKQNKKIEEMSEVFNGIAKYTNKRSIVYGNGG